MFYTTDIIEVTRQTGLTLTWQEAEERHEDHRQEAEGGNPGESLLAPHRAHLEFSNFNIKYHENRCIYWCKKILYHVLYRGEQEEHIWNTIIITLYDVADSMF